MRKLSFLILTFLVVLIIAGSRILISPCDTPIHYRIDAVDVKFNLAKDKFIEDAKKAATIWNKAYGKDVLVFDPKGNLSINLIYDERQRLNYQISNLEGVIKNEKGTLDPLIAQFEKDVASFKARLADLNSQIETWNQKGGAPPDIYNQLIQTQKDLHAEADRLDQRSKSLNLTTQNFNSQVDSLNTKITTFNTALLERPEEGIYIPDQNRIEIYFDITDRELIHTLAHEMGHSLGFEHVTDPKSVMYVKSTEILVPSKEDLEELKRVCAKKNLFEIVISKVKIG